MIPEPYLVRPETVFGVGYQNSGTLTFAENGSDTTEKEGPSLRCIVLLRVSYVLP